MNIIDTVWFKVAVLLICLGLIFIKCDAIAGEVEPPAVQWYVTPASGDPSGAIPEQVRIQRDWTPKRSIIYHNFACGDYNIPDWSILMRANGQFIIGSPSAIDSRPDFISLVFKDVPIQLFHYEPCRDHGDPS